MKIRHPILIVAGLGCSVWGFLYRPFPMPGENAALDLMLYHTPNFYTWIVWWYYLAPAAAVIVGGLFLITVWRVWFNSWGIAMPNIGMLPTWPLNPAKDAGPAIVVGEVHPPVKAVESNNPKWLTIPERGLEDEHHVFAKALVDTGRYASVSAVIQQGIKLLRQCLDVEYLGARGESVSEGEILEEWACEEEGEVRQWRHGDGHTKTTGTTGRFVDRGGRSAAVWGASIL